MSVEARVSYPPPGAATVSPVSPAAGSMLVVGALSPPGAVSATYDPVFENGVSCPFREVALTAMTPGYAAGYLA